jgi:hypothetical protein
VDTDRYFYCVNVSVTTLSRTRRRHISERVAVPPVANDSAVVEAAVNDSGVNDSGVNDRVVVEVAVNDSGAIEPSVVNEAVVISENDGGSWDDFGNTPTSQMSDLGENGSDNACSAEMDGSEENK